MGLKSENKASEQENGRVIVTYGRSLIALMIAQSLGSRGIDVIGCDDVDLTVLSFSKYVSRNATLASPFKKEEKFLDELQALIRQHKPNDDRPYLLIPSFIDGKIIAKHADRFKNLITIAGPDFKSIDSVHPKNNLARTAMELDVEVPKTWFYTPGYVPSGEIGEMTFPVIIKPPDESAGRGVTKCPTEQSLLNAYKKLRQRYPNETLLIQEAAPGDEYCYCGLFDNGELIASMVYQNLQKYPEGAGPGVVRETKKAERFDALASDLMRPLAWSGVAEIDFLWTGQDSDTPKMIEVNPRFWMGLDHSIKSDIDFPWLLYRQFAGLEIEEFPQAKTGHKTSLPGLTALGRINSFFSETINFDELQKKMPDIKQHYNDREYRQAVNIFKKAMQESVSFDQAFQNYKKLSRDAKKAEKISYTEDDPFIGLGVLFIIGSLIRHGEIPPELRH